MYYFSLSQLKIKNKSYFLFCVAESTSPSPPFFHGGKLKHHSIKSALFKSNWFPPPCIWLGQVSILILLGLPLILFITIFSSKSSFFVGLSDTILKKVLLKCHPELCVFCYAINVTPTYCFLLCISNWRDSCVKA